MPSESPSADAPEAIVRRAYRIAVRDLRACYNPDGIVAGRLHFNAYWARDGFWASFGALALGDHEQVRAHLDTFVRFQMASGELPVRIEFLGHTFGHYHTRRTQPKALFRVGTIFSDPHDPTALFVIAAREYFERTHDMDFCGRFEPAMDRAMTWLMRHDRDDDGLLENRYLAGWMDSILKKDKVFYLNLTFYEGLRACRAIKAMLGHAADVRRFDDAAARTGERLQQVFWNGAYFTDWVRDHGAADSRPTATCWRYCSVSPARIRRARSCASSPRSAWTRTRRCAPAIRSIPSGKSFHSITSPAFPDYHRTLIWPWLGTLNAINKARRGDRVSALADLARIGAWYVRDNAVTEVYEPSGHPVARRFFQAELPFAWNAGLYVYAVRVFGLMD